MLRNTVRECGIRSFQPITDEEMKMQLGPDLIKLFEEAEAPNGDQTSKKICESI
jgi:hypothetical protein